MSERRATDCQRIIAFYRGEGRDDRGRTLADILAFNDEALEYTHDYIQWLFPLDVPSSVQPLAPLVDRQCQEQFRAEPNLALALRQALKTMLDFYGFQISGDSRSIAITRARDFPRRAKTWLTHGNHNFLRLTRIMTSLDLLGEHDLATALQTSLAEVSRDFPQVVGETTRRYWMSAIPKS